MVNSAENVANRRLQVLASHLGGSSSSRRQQQQNRSQISHSVTSQMRGANFPLAEDGSTYHLETKLSEVANRILTVGDPTRAERISKYLDCIFLDKTSHRGFRTITGLYKSVPVSIVAIGMGIAAMDFFIRECRAVIDGDMAIVRIGTCGVVKPDVPVGSVIIQKSSICVQRNPDGFREVDADELVVEDSESSIAHSSDEESVSSTSDDEHQREDQSTDDDEDDLHYQQPEKDSLAQPSTSPANAPRPTRIVKGVRREPYYVTLPVEASPELVQLLQQNISRHVDPKSIVLGLNATADSFYSSQGRTAMDFMDKNDTLVEELIEKIPEVTSLEMETFHLFDMAAVCRRGRIHAGSCTIALAQRNSEEFLDNKVKKLREKQLGVSVLDTLIQLPLADEMKEGIWTQGKKKVVNKTAMTPAPQKNEKEQ